ncbi:hypothetical protein Q9Q99_04805 [Curtobacterium flaccumfaciens]|nr:hypothetical protein Q9Q99_04805 [Curtobacterium flaccumfaciens]
MSEVAKYNFAPTPAVDAPSPSTTTTSHAHHSPTHKSSRAPKPQGSDSVLRPAGLGRVLLTFASHILVPLFLAAGMGLAYLGAFHAPAPHELPVGIVGQGAATQVFAQTVTDQSDGALVAHVVASTKAAEQQVRDRDLAAVYAPTATGATLFVSTAASETTASAAQKVFLPIAYDQHVPFRVVDVVPTGDQDTTGQGLFFLLVALSVGGYASAIAVASVATKLRTVWTRGHRPGHRRGRRGDRCGRRRPGLRRHHHAPLAGVPVRLALRRGHRRARRRAAPRARTVDHPDPHDAVRDAELHVLRRDLPAGVPARVLRRAAHLLERRGVVAGRTGPAVLPGCVARPTVPRARPLAGGGAPALCRRARARRTPDPHRPRTRGHPARGRRGRRRVATVGWATWTSAPTWTSPAPSPTPPTRSASSASVPQTCT